MQDGRKKQRIVSLAFSSLLVWVAAAHSTGRLAAQAAAKASSDEQAQIEKGRQVVGQTCVACHTNILRMAQVHKQSPEQWRDTVYSMIGRGAQILPDEIEPLTAFLAATYGLKEPAQASQTPAAGRPVGGRVEQQSPDAEGRAILQRSCQQCHSQAVASTKLASEDWGAVIARMMTYGAKLTPADQQKLIGYLSGPGR